jgi:hypothetical protein
MWFLTPFKPGSAVARLLAARPWLLLVALPLLLLTLEPDWIFPCPCRDTWIYYGFFENGADFLGRYADTYYAARLPVIVPGWVAHHLLPPLAANVVLHLAVWGVSVGSLYALASRLYGNTTAIVVAAVFGAHPMFVHTASWDYTDGFGVAYFFLALWLLQRAIDGRQPFVSNLGAGGAAAALVAANLSYALLLPWLAAHYVFAGRVTGRRLLRGFWPLLVGGVLALWGFGAFNAIAGGPFDILEAQIRFARNFLAEPNPFRDPAFRWIPKAVWLVFPALTTGAALVVVAASRLGKSIRSGVLLPQVLLLGYASSRVYGQFWGDRGWLEHFYASTPLLAVAFVAFAGQLALSIGEGEPSLSKAPLWSALAAVLLPWLLAQEQPTVGLLLGGAWPVLLPLALGVGQVAGVFGGWGRKGATLILLSLALSQSLVAGLPPTHRWFQFHHFDGARRYVQMTTAVRAVDELDPSRRARLWYDAAEPELGIYFDSVASAFLLCPRMIGMSFPLLEAAVMCDGKPLLPGQTIILLSGRADALAAASDALGRVGLGVHRLRRVEIEGPLAGFVLDYLEVEARVPAPELGM